MILKEGSKEYPYEGMLRRLAALGLSNVPNAWTSRDMTYYMLNSVGDQEFLRALPFAVNHILFPTLTKSSFTTEVRRHHRVLNNSL